MIHDQEALRNAQLRTFSMLGNKSTAPDGKTTVPSVPEYNITSPAILQQEQPFNNATSRYIFDYSQNAPIRVIGAAGLNNVVIGQNDIFGCYGIQVALGVGNVLQGRVYNSFGTLATDDTLYSGELLMKWASTEPVEQFPMQIFREIGAAPGGYAGFQFIRPIRKWVGSVSTVEVTIDIPNLTGIVLTADQFLRVTLHGALGVA